MTDLTIEQAFVMDRLAMKFTVGDGCWEWTAGKDGKGYGGFKIRGVDHKAHRVVYELLEGPIPDGLVIDHLCRNPGCVRPSHLEPVTTGENTLRGLAPSARNAKKTHCDHGHEYTPANTMRTRSKRNPFGRRCRACHNARAQADRDTRALLAEMANKS